MYKDDLSHTMNWSLRAGRTKLSGDRTLERNVKPGLNIEPLSDRVMPVVGAFNVPQAIRPNKANAGVVLIRQSPDDIGGCSGTLLTGGQTILTAAHCVDANGDHIADAPYYYVNFDLPAKRVQMVVPANRVTINPQWEGATNAGFQNGHDEAVLRLSGLAPWGNGPGRLSYQLYTGSSMQPGTSSSSNSINLVGYGYTGDGVVGQNTSPNPNQISSTIQRLMLPPSARGSFTLGNPKTKANIRLNAQGLTADVVQKAVQGLDPTGFVNVQVVQITQKSSPYFGSFDIVFRQVDTTQYPYGKVPQFTFRPQAGYSGGAQGGGFRSGIMRPAYPTLLGAKSNASTRFNASPEGMGNVFVTQLSASRGLALLGEGDSGGPALLRKQIVGVASFFSGASQYGDYSGWSNISPDLTWIQSNSKVGGNVVIDLATQPVTRGKVTDYVSVKGDKQHDKMIVLVHGRPLFKAPMSSVQTLQIVPRGVPVKFRTISHPTFQVSTVPNSQRGYLGKTEKVVIMGETTTSPAVVNARNSTLTTASLSTVPQPTLTKSVPGSSIESTSIQLSSKSRKRQG